jgi:hypothetical protein
MEEILDIVKSDPDFRNDVKLELEKYDSAAIVNQAAAGRTFMFQKEAYRKTILIAGDVIYEQALENDAMRDKLKEYGVYDKQEIDNMVTIKKNNTENPEKNSRILSIVREKMKRNKRINKQLR